MCECTYVSAFVSAFINRRVLIACTFVRGIMRALTFYLTDSHSWSLFVCSCTDGKVAEQTPRSTIGQRNHSGMHHHGVSTLHSLLAKGWEWGESQWEWECAVVGLSHSGTGWGWILDTSRVSFDRNFDMNKK